MGMAKFEKCLPLLPTGIREQVLEAVKAAKDAPHVQRGLSATGRSDGFMEAAAEVTRGLRQFPVETQDQVIEAMKRSRGT